MRNRIVILLRAVGVILCIGTITLPSVNAQCSNSLSTRTYDTVLTSNGFGMYALNFPQWSPDSGLLVSVKIAATVSSQYGFTLRNADINPATYSLTLGQEDMISSTALSSTYTGVMSQFQNNYALDPGQAVITAPFPFLTNHISSDSITDNVAPFMGSGQVSFNYMSFTYTNLNTVNNATYFYSANIADNMHFTVQYLYCTNGGTVLAADLTRFSAELNPLRTTRLAWAAVNESAGRIYDIQRSGDSKTFTTIGSVSASGTESSADYTYSDNLADSSTGKYYYRLQIHDQDNLTFSKVRMVSLFNASNTETAQVYPNPATNYINIVTGQAADDWRVEILSANGSLVQQQTALQTSAIRINFTNKLATGAYFVHLTNLHSQKQSVLPFVVVER